MWLYFPFRDRKWRGKSPFYSQPTLFHDFQSESFSLARIHMKVDM